MAIPTGHRRGEQHPAVDAVFAALAIQDRRTLGGAADDIRQVRPASSRCVICMCIRRANKCFKDQQMRGSKRDSAVAERRSGQIFGPHEEIGLNSNCRGVCVILAPSSRHTLPCVGIGHARRAQACTPELGSGSSSDTAASATAASAASAGAAAVC